MAASRQLVEQVGRIIAEASLPYIKNLGDQALQEARLAANNFLAEYHKYQTEIKWMQQNWAKFRQLKTIGQASSPSTNISIANKNYSEIKQFHKTVQQLEQDAINFQFATTIFTGRIQEILTGNDVKMSIVIPAAGTGGAPAVYEFTVPELERMKSRFTATLKDGSLTLRIDTANLSKEAEETESKYINENALADLNFTYNTVDLDYKKWHPYVFWKNEGEEHWHALRIGGAGGDIAEAYAYFFYGGSSVEVTNYQFSRQIYNEEMNFFITSGVTQVDSVAAAYTSDIMNQSVNRAVKSVKASFAGYKQTRNFAEQIVDTTAIQDMTELQAAILDNLFYKKKSGEGWDSQAPKGLRNEVYNSLQEAYKDALSRKKTAQKNTGVINLFMQTYNIDKDQIQIN